MKVPFYGHVRQYTNIKAEIDANIKKVIDSGEYVHGPMNKQFEQEFAAFSGTKYSIPCGNGTDALWLTLMALGIGKGDEVITNGGLAGVVMDIGDNFVTVEVAENVRIRVQKGAVGNVLPAGTLKSAQ